jgi:hypothetical protein
MHTIERTLPGRGLGSVAEPAESRDVLFGRRDQTNSWHPQMPWVRLLLAPPLKNAEDTEATPEKTTFKHDEVSVEAISLSVGQVAIKVTDEQAKHIEMHYKGDAFPSH